MKRLAAILLAMLCGLAACAHDASPFPQMGSFYTHVSTPLPIEGLTGDADGNLYTAGRGAGAGIACPVWRIALTNVTPVIVGFIPPPSQSLQCSPLGLAFGPDGRLFVSDADKIYVVSPNAASPVVASVYAANVPGTNGLAFDRRGALWTGDGTTGLGRVWRIAPGGAVTEVFRIQPMVNAAGVGREVRTMPPGNPQPLVANGIAFGEDGDMLVSDNARGAIWRVSLDRDGNLKSRTGCDSTFAPNTLCLDNVFIAHPWLEGADGIAIDQVGNIWIAVNERNAVAVVTRKGGVEEVFRNPPDATTAFRNTGLLEFPTSPFLAGSRFCTANSDGNRRDNSPNTAGEITGSAAARGKISCLDRPLLVPGLSMPVRDR